jgi:hypothetical protein
VFCSSRSNRPPDFERRSTRRGMRSGRSSDSAPMSRAGGAIDRAVPSIHRDQSPAPSGARVPVAGRRPPADLPSSAITQPICPVRRDRSTRPARAGPAVAWILSVRSEPQADSVLQRQAQRLPRSSGGDRAVAAAASPSSAVLWAPSRSLARRRVLVHESADGGVEIRCQPSRRRGAKSTTT